LPVSVRGSGSKTSTIASSSFAIETPMFIVAS
jgi:hypothetical protein